MSSFCTGKATHIFFSKKFQHICVSLDVNFNKSLTNDIVSFEQLGPGLRCQHKPKDTFSHDAANEWFKFEKNMLFYGLGVSTQQCEEYLGIVDTILVII